MVFHGADRSLEARNLLDLEDVNGVRFVQLLIQAAQAGGGYVEYHYDDPVLTGDEDIGSPKLSYAESFVARSGREVVFGAGIYFDLSEHVPEITLSVDPESLTESGGAQTVTVTATQTSEILPVSTMIPLSLSGTATGDDYSVSGEMSITIPAEARVGSTQLTLTVSEDALNEPGETIVVTALHDEEELATATIAVTDPVFTEVEATVLGDSVEGLTVEFSRAIAGRPRDYAWSGVTDAAGQVSLTISGANLGSGFFQARARTAEGDVVGQWHSIPLNRGRRQVLELTLGGGMRVLAAERLPAAKQAAAPEEPLVSGLEPNAPNPFNSTTLIPYRHAEPGWRGWWSTTPSGSRCACWWMSSRLRECTRSTGTPAISRVRRWPRESMSRACNTPEECRRGGCSTSGNAGRGSGGRRQTCYLRSRTPSRHQGKPQRWRPTFGPRPQQEAGAGVIWGRERQGAGKTSPKTTAGR